MKNHVFRLHPGQDLKLEIDKYTQEHNIKASFILTCVGSLTKATIRMAGDEEINTYVGNFEIVSLVGTAENGYSHLHIAISDKKGETIGGHLKSPSAVETTAEVVIGEIENFLFEREFDNNTGYKELAVRNVTLQ